MTDLPPSDPTPSPRDRDELIAVVVAFAAIGSILVWGLTRNDGLDGWNGVIGSTPWLQPSPNASSDANPPVLPFFNPQSSPQTGESENRNRVVEPLPTDLEGRSPQTSSTISPVVPVPVEPYDAAPAETSETAESAVVAAVPPVEASPASTPVSYSDVPADYWAYPFIAGLTQRGIVTGFEDGTFRPDQPLSRAEYAAQVQQIFDQQKQNAITFQDVPSDFWARSAIDTAVKIGFLKGYPGNVFRPDQPIPRYQVLLSLANGFDLNPPANPATVVSTYQDNAQLPGYAVPAIAAATSKSIVVNYPDINVLHPNRSATRAEVAAMIYQALVATGRAEPIQSNYIVQP
ncbi:MAG TPA: S-layer homology domain-containing protein [Crinalium sp.]